MVLRRTCRIFTYLILIMAGLSLTACTGENVFPGISTVPATSTPQGAAIEPVLRDFHRALGGAQVLGGAISPLFQKGDAQCQYTPKALICYNPLLPDRDQYYLYPISLDLQIHDEPVPVTGAGRERVVNGYVISAEFRDLYDRLFGERYVGRPVTQIWYNQSKGRVEQYFENMGFARNLDAPPGVVELIDLGGAHCGLKCGQQVDMGIIQKAVPEPFRDQIERLGGKKVFGGPLTGPVVYPDGTILQVYERAVFSAPGGDLSKFRLEPAPLILAIAFDLPTEKFYDDRYVFYSVEDGRGYNVPVVFDRFITEHGSMEISGRPITEVFRLNGQDTLRQCFENYCLDYTASMPQGLRIRLAALGQNYMQLNGLEPYRQQDFVFSQETVLLQVGEANPRIGLEESQVVTLVVLKSYDQRPLANVTAELNLLLPDGSAVRFAVPPTGANGSSQVIIPPQPAIPNGTVVQYQVCLQVESDTPLCAAETYLVWSSN